MSGTYGFCQTPLKSTLPEAVLGVGPAGGRNSRWPAASVGKTTVIASAASRLAAKCVFTERLLLLLWRRWIVATRGTGKYAPAVRKLYRARVAGLRAILRQHAVDGDLVARLQG